MDDIFVGQVMTDDPKTVAATTTVEEAAESMLEDGIGSLLIVADEGRLQGVLTRTDFVKLVAEHGATDDQAHVSERMTTDVITTTVGTSIQDAADIMLENGFHHLPVVDDDGVVVGIVTTTDLAKYLSSLRLPDPS